jgi:hypothetical protein
VDRDEMLRVLEAFEAEGLEYVLIGGAAMTRSATEDLLGDYPALRYYPPAGDLYFDVMTRLGELGSYDTVESEIMNVAGVRVPVATPAALRKLKKNTARHLDWQDAEALRRRFDLQDD